MFDDLVSYQQSSTIIGAYQEQCDRTSSSKKSTMIKVKVQTHTIADAASCYEQELILCNKGKSYWSATAKGFGRPGSRQKGARLKSMLCLSVTAAVHNGAQSRDRTLRPCLHNGEPNCSK